MDLSQIELFLLRRMADKNMQRPWWTLHEGVLHCCICGNTIDGREAFTAYPKDDIEAACLYLEHMGQIGVDVATHAHGRMHLEADGWTAEALTALEALSRLVGKAEALQQTVDSRVTRNEFRTAGCEPAREP